MILLRAIPLSLSIFWRMLIIFPFLLIVVIAYGIVVGFAGLFLALLISPFVLIFLGTTFIMACTVGPLLVCTRVGLELLGQKPLNSYRHLFLPSMGYGFLVGIVSAIVVCGAIAFFFWRTGLGMAELNALDSFGNSTSLWDAMAAHKSLLLTTLLSAGLLLFAFYAALLVPMASASIGRDPNGQRHTPFSNFGAGFVPLLIVVVFVSVAYEYSGDLIYHAANLIGYGDVIGLAQSDIHRMADGFTQPKWRAEFGIILAGILLFGLWLTCYQCAGAALVYVKQTDNDAGSPLLQETTTTQPLAPKKHALYGRTVCPVSKTANTTQKRATSLLWFGPNRRRRLHTVNPTYPAQVDPNGPAGGTSAQPRVSSRIKRPLPQLS